VLSSLSIRDVVLIERLDLNFNAGLTVLTGETGAGKSILLDSLGLALGARSEQGLVRQGAVQASVSALFTPPADHPALGLLAEQGIASDGEIVFRRIVAKDGRSRAFVNDQPVGAGLLKRVGALLVEVQGQGDQMGLADPAVHAILLDGFGVPAPVRRTATASPAQLEGRLIRLPSEDDGRVWYVESGIRRELTSPMAGRLRFGDGWQRLIQPLPSAGDLGILPEGSPLTLAEAAEGKLVYSWPHPETYLVQAGRKRLIIDDAAVKERFGPHWRIQLVHLRPADLAEIPDGDPISSVL